MTVFHHSPLYQLNSQMTVGDSLLTQILNEQSDKSLPTFEDIDNTFNFDFDDIPDLLPPVEHNDLNVY